MKPAELLQPEQRRPSKAYLVNELRKAVFTWREQGYPNITDTTRRLLQLWFEENHIESKEGHFWKIFEKNKKRIQTNLKPREFFDTIKTEYKKSLSRPSSL